MTKTKPLEPIDKDIFRLMHDRRSIRKFLDKPIPQAVLEKILKAGFRSPFAYQLCSIIYTKDKDKLKKLRGMGVYPTTQVLLVFLVDVRRLEKIVEQRNHRYDTDDGMTLWLGIQDATLAAGNIITAAEALGLGSVLLGNAPRMANFLAEFFEIPERVFPVVGLCLGYPDPVEDTDVRPRFPLKFSAFEDAYLDLSESQVKECMKTMDKGYLAQGYYIKLQAKIPLVKGRDIIDYDRYSWSEHISRKVCQGRFGDPLIKTIRERGFDLT